MLSTSGLYGKACMGGGVTYMLPGTEHLGRSAAAEAGIAEAECLQ